MRDGLFSIVIAAALGCVGGSACAMTAEQDPAACRVIGGEKLPAQSGGPDALCKAIKDAAAELAPGVSYDIQVTVLPRSRLTASVTMGDGQKLEDLNFARMDKPLSNGAFKRFASAIAAELAKSGGKKS